MFLAEMGSTVGFVVVVVVVVGPVVAVVRSTAEIAGTFGNWEPFGAKVDN